MLKLSGLKDDNGYSGFNILQQSDTINAVKLSANTGDLDAVPAGANYAVITSSAPAYVLFDILPSLPGSNVTDGSAPELIPVNGALMRYVPYPASTKGSISLTAVSTTGTSYITAASTTGSSFLNAASTTGTLYITAASTTGTNYITAKSTTGSSYITGASTTGDIDVLVSTTTLTVVSAAGFKVGETIVIVGAGATGTDLTTTISLIVSNTITIADEASTTVTGAAVTATTSAVKIRVASATNLKAGETITIAGAGPAGATLTTTISGISGSVLTIADAISTDVTTAAVAAVTSTTLLKLASATNFKVGETIVVTGAGAAAADLTTTIDAINGNVITLHNAATTDVTGTGVVATTSTTLLRLTSPTNFKVGETIVITGADAGGADLTTYISGLSGSIATLHDAATTDVTNTLVTATTSTIKIRVASTSNFKTGETITITGAGSGGNLVTTITNITGNIFTIADTILTDVTGAAVAAVTNTKRLVLADSTGLVIGDTILVTGASTGGADLTTVVDNVNGNIITLHNAVITDVTGTAVESTAILTKTLTVVSTTGFKVNNKITITGAGTSGADLTTLIDSINTTDNEITIHDSASTAVNNANVVKVNVIGVISASSCIVTLAYYK